MKTRAEVMETAYGKLQQMLLNGEKRESKIRPLITAAEDQMARHLIPHETAKAMAAGLKGIKPETKKKGKKERQPAESDHDKPQ